MTAEVGWLRFTGGIAGDYLLALDPESMEDAYAACPGLPLYRPREIAVLAEVHRLATPAAVACVAAAKRIFAEGSRWGAVIEAVNHPVGVADEAEAA